MLVAPTRIAGGPSPRFFIRWNPSRLMFSTCWTSVLESRRFVEIIVLPKKQKARNNQRPRGVYG